MECQINKEADNIINALNIKPLQAIEISLDVALTYIKNKREGKTTGETLAEILGKYDGCEKILAVMAFEDTVITYRMIEPLIMNQQFSLTNLPITMR